MGPGIPGISDLTWMMELKWSKGIVIVSGGRRFAPGLGAAGEAKCIGACCA